MTLFFDDFFNKSNDFLFFMSISVELVKNIYFQLEVLKMATARA